VLNVPGIRVQSPGDNRAFHVKQVLGFGSAPLLLAHVPVGNHPIGEIQEFTSILEASSHEQTHHTDWSATTMPDRVVGREGIGNRQLNILITGYFKLEPVG
jgi:hypothetical protein